MCKNALCHTAESDGTSADVPTTPATAELEPSGVWTEWVNNFNPYEEGQRGDLEIRTDMDPVSSDRCWIFSIDGSYCISFFDVSYKSTMRWVYKLFSYVYMHTDLFHKQLLPMWKLMF